MSSMMAPWVLAVLMAVLVVGILGVLVGVRVVASRVEHHDPDATEAHENAVADTRRHALESTATSDDPPPP